MSATLQVIAGSLAESRPWFLGIETPSVAGSAVSCNKQTKLLETPSPEGDDGRQFPVYVALRIDRGGPGAAAVTQRWFLCGRLDPHGSC
jgi:hypothetical protein